MLTIRNNCRIVSSSFTRHTENAIKSSIWHMHLITMMNYREKNPLLMCKAWIYLAKRYNPEANISIFYHDNISEIRRFAKQYQRITFTKLHFPKGVNKLTQGMTHHPDQELRLSLWKQLEIMRITKFIYIDADAFILSPLTDWWSIIDSQPYIAIAECKMPSGFLRLNAGVHSYSDTTGLVSYEKLLMQYQRDGNRILVDTGEQGLIYSYFRSINYAFSHNKIGHEYNTLAKHCIVKKVDDSDIVVYSGNYPFMKKIYRISQFEKKDFVENWLWWGKQVRVKILHAFGGPGQGYKFWNLPECSLLWQYCMKKIS